MTDRIAVITGASRGLGASMALHLSRAGVGVVGTYNSNRDEARKVEDAIRNDGGSVAFLQLDTSTTTGFPGFLTALAATLRETFDQEGFDYLVNNAGIGLRAPYPDTTEEQFDRLMAINVKAPFFLTQQLLGLLRDGGRVLNLSSGLARFTTPGNSAYAATKGAVEVLTRYQAKELGERGIRVNVIAPGAIETDFGEGMVRDNKDVNAMIASNTALGRVGQADDVGAAVAAVLSDAFAWADGSRIEVSGGQSL